MFFSGSLAIPLNHVKPGVVEVEGLIFPYL